MLAGSFMCHVVLDLQAKGRGTVPMVFVPTALNVQGKQVKIIIDSGPDHKPTQ